MHLFRVTVFCSCSFLVACASDHKPTVAPAAFSTLPRQEQEFYLDAYQEMFAWRGDAFPEFRRYFVTFLGHDAPPDLLAALRARGFTVYPGTRWRQGRGMQCEAGKLEWLSPTKVRFRGGWLYGNVGGQWGPLVFSKRNGHWKMVSFTMEEIA